MTKTPDEIRNLLRTVDTGITVVFEKTDGSLRTMKATLFPELIPTVPESNNPRKQSEAAIRVFDLDKKEWRSFRFDSVKEIKTNE